jgi:glycosyltransferase involved in cell wall biosynthesis
VSPDLAGTATDPIRGRLDHSGMPAGAEELEIVLCRSRPPSRFAFAPSIGRVLRREVEAADVIHVHGLYLYPQLATYRQATRQKVPYIVAPCGSLSPYTRQRGRIRKAITDFTWQRPMLHKAAMIHYKSAAEAAGAADLKIKAPTYIAPNGIRSLDYQQLPDGERFRERYLDGRSGPLIVTIGRIAPVKGLDILIEAFRAILVRHPDAMLAIVGPDDKRLIPSLRALAAREGVMGRVVFPGELHGRELLEALGAATVWALPSRMENFGNAMVEALAAGVPCVVSSAVDLASDLQSAGAAEVAPPVVEPFANAVSNVLDDEPARSRLSELGRKFAMQFDWSEMALEHIKMYEHARGEAG